MIRPPLPARSATVIFDVYLTTLRSRRVAKTLTEAKLTTREARRKLAVGVHWRGIDPDVHLGYRKGKRGGAWLVRWRCSKGYRQHSLGVADDELKEGTLDFNAAAKAAKAKVNVERQRAKAAADGPLLTVERAVELYIAERDRRDTARKGVSVRSDASSRLGRYVIGVSARGNRKGVPAAAIADVPLHMLDEGHLFKWRAALPSSLKAATKQRLINDLRRHSMAPILGIAIPCRAHCQRRLGTVYGPIKLRITWTTLRAIIKSWRMRRLQD